MRDKKMQICEEAKVFQGCDFAVTVGANFRGKKVLR